MLLGAAAVLSQSINMWRTALITNLVVLAGVLLGIAALAAGAGPRTASNDLYHRVMLVLIGASLVVLFCAVKVESNMNERQLFLEGYNHSVCL